MTGRAFSAERTLCRMNKKILAVGDSKMMCQMVLATLRGAGYEVVLACDGAKALEKARTGSVDLVLTDVYMPRMDGITVNRRRRLTVVNYRCLFTQQRPVATSNLALFH